MARGPSPFTRGGLEIGGKYFSKAEVDRIRAMNQARAQGPAIPSVEPIGSEQAAAMKFAGHGSGVIDPTRTATQPAVVQKLRAEFGDPGVAGYNLFRSVVGKNAAAYVPGTRPPLGFRPDPVKALSGVAAALPSIRLAGAGLDAVRAAQAGGELGDAFRASMSSYGPVARVAGRTGASLRAAGVPRPVLRLAGLPSRVLTGPRPVFGAGPALRVANRVSVNNSLPKRYYRYEMSLRHPQAQRPPGPAGPVTR